MINIRKFEDNDYDDLYRLLSDPETMKYLEPPFSKEKARDFLTEAGMTEPPLIYAVEFDDVFAGYVICHDFDECSVEIGWALLPEFRKRGVATKLTEMLVERAISDNKDVVIECVKEQEASKRIAEKFGFVFEGVEDGLKRYRSSKFKE